MKILVIKKYLIDISLMQFLKKLNQKILYKIN